MAGCCRGHKSKPTSREEKIFHLHGLYSDGGEHLIEETLEQIDGVHFVQVDQGQDMVKLNYNPEVVTEDHLISTLTTLGFTVLGMESKLGL